MIAPSGQPSPLERQSVTVSNSRPQSAAGRAARDDGVHEPRSVEVDGEAVRTSLGDDLPEVRRAAKPCPPPPLCVFSMQTRRVGAACRSPGGLTASRNCSAVKIPCVGRKRLHRQPGVDGRPAELVEEDVRHRLGDDLVARLGQRAKRDLVRHRRRREEDGLLVAEQRRGALLERDDGRVLALLLVPDDGIGDRAAHLRASAA